MVLVTFCKVAEEGTAEVTISFEELREISGFNSHWSEKEFMERVDEMTDKQMSARGRIEKGGDIAKFTLFPSIKIKENKTISVKTDTDYLYILTELKKNFTRFELQEFVTLDSKYAKILYRLLKQFRTTGLLRITIEEFRRIMEVPEKYSNRRMYDKIINPSIRYLEKCFDNLECKTVYEKKPGRPVKGYEFTFTPEEVARISTTAAAPGRKKPVNAFHNFEQREYDYDALEKALIERTKK